MHDGGGDRSQTIEGLRQALPKLKEQGYSFITVQELLEKYPLSRGPNELEKISIKKIKNIPLRASRGTNT